MAENIFIMQFSSGDISKENNKRVNDILEVVMAYARLDFSKKTEVLGADDALDAIGAGVNMLGEELENSTISLKEKEQLLKEIHHRVKNNLQIVSSLLNLQTDSILDETYLGLIIESRNRINSMALVHEMLYSSKDLSRIEISRYIHRLCISIHQSLARRNSAIDFDYTIEDNLSFDIDHMIPLGLIINEIISNSFKYAFPDDKGVIRIALHRTAHGYQLQIRDDGVGLPEHFNVETDANLGIQLIHMLTEQIDGTVKIDRNKGTSYQISFSD